MTLRLLEMVSYFFSGSMSLRRAPRANDDGTFIFANLIDYKSFEFLSKLYKISERLVEHDLEQLTLMDMWLKVCGEGGGGAQEANCEVLAKFLVHNLSSIVLRLKPTPTALGNTIG